LILQRGQGFLNHHISIGPARIFEFAKGEEEFFAVRGWDLALVIKRQVEAGFVFKDAGRGFCFPLCLRDSVQEILRESEFSGGF
jgi:hypothetical protein